MTERSPLDPFRAELGAFLNVDPTGVSLFWKGRVALYALLRALGIGAGDEVVIPAFTCVVVPNAVMYTGAVPVYADIDALTLTVDPARVASSLSPRTRAVLAQNVFGLPADLDALSGVLTGSGIALLDDACHGLGSEHSGARLSSKVVGAFYSTQWSKPISSGLGGIAVSADPNIARVLRDVEREARPPQAFQVASLALLRMARGAVTGRLSYERMRSAYHALTGIGIGVPSSESAELDRPAMPEDFLRRMAPSQAAHIRRALPALPARVERRRQVARYYDGLLSRMGKQPPFVPTYARHSYLRYPLMSSDRPALVRAAKRSRVDLGDWFISPLHPVRTGLERWHYSLGSCPVAERTAERVVNLPTNPEAGSRELARVARFLSECEPLIDPGPPG